MYWNMKQNKRNVSAPDDWLSRGGTAHDGTTYGPPSSATAWGKIGCPLVPRIYRIHYGQRTAPPLMKRALKAPNLTLRDLDSELLGRFNMVEIPPQFSESMRELFYLLPILGEVAIPSGIPVSWFTKLPLKGRLRNALGRYFWPHTVIVKEPIKCAELMAIPAVGKNSLHELLCVLESAESKKSHAEKKSSPTVSDVTARIQGRLQVGLSEKNVTSERSINEQDETEHGERPPSTPPTTDVTLGRIGKRESFERHVQEQGGTEHGEQPPSTPSTTDVTWGRVGKREISERHVQKQDEAEHDRIGTKDKTSPTVAEMTARILGRVQLGHTENTVASDKSVREKDETKQGEIPQSPYLAAKDALGHSRNSVTPDKYVSEKDATELGEIPPTTYLAAKGTLRLAEDRALSKRHSPKQDDTEYDRIQADNEVLPVMQDSHDSPPRSAFEKAVCETARQALRAAFLHFDSHEEHSTDIDIDKEREVVCSVSALGDLLREFASWARAETNAQTIGDAISHVILGTGNVEEWQAIAEFSLNQAGYMPNHPYTILESWVNQLPKRERHIFDTRIARLDATTSLQDLGEFFGVTRERVRQLEGKLRTKLTEFVGGEEGKPIRWRAKTVRQMIGVASPPGDQIDSATGEIHHAFSTQIEDLLSPLPGQTDFREVVLKLAGPYELINGWLVLKSAVASDPTRRIREMTDSVGYIDHEQATNELNKWGLNPCLHEKWLVRDNRIRNLNGRLVRWEGSIGDKLVIALAEIGRPATIDDLLEYTQENRAKSSAANALSNDTRAVRVNRKEWALVSWGLSEYSSIAISIRNVLRRQKQPVLVEDIVAFLSKDMGMKENSIRAYCQAPMFIIENGAVRLRRDDERYEYDKVSLQKAKGVFALGPRRASLLIEVDSELLRGSGRLLTYAAGSVLGVAPNQSLTFTSRDGDAVTVTFPETSLIGPLIGSLRSLAMSSNASSSTVFY